MPRRLFRILLILLLLPPILAAAMGWLAAPSFLHPVRRPLTPGLVREADASFAHSRARAKIIVDGSRGVPHRGARLCTREVPADGPRFFPAACGRPVTRA